MSESRQAALFLLSTLAFVAAFGALIMDFKIFDEYRADNQTIATLRAQIHDLKSDLTDTEKALEESAADAFQLKNELYRRDTDDEAKAHPRGATRS